MAFGAKTNERPGTRAQARNVHTSAYKAREVLNVIRGENVAKALEILDFVERDIALVIRKCLESAIANAEHNDGQSADELYVSACYADEGATMKRWRPRARGRATRIRKRTCHITIIVSRMDDAALALLRAQSGTSATGNRAAAEARRERVTRSRSAKAEKRAADEEAAEQEHDDHDHEDHDHEDHDDAEVAAVEETDDTVEASNDAEVESTPDDTAPEGDADAEEKDD